MNKPESEATSGRSVTTLVAGHVESPVQCKEMNTLSLTLALSCIIFLALLRYSLMTTPSLLHMLNNGE